MRKLDQLQTMDAAWNEAQQCSIEIAQLLAEARNAGRTIPEIYSRINSLNDQYDDAMRRYKAASRRYYEEVSQLMC
jgi:hypothetical protein